MADRALVWALLSYGLPGTPALRREILGRQDTHVLYVWRVQAAQLIEEIADTLQERGADEHYPERGMQG